MSINLLKKITKKLILIFEKQYLSMLCQLANSNRNSARNKNVLINFIIVNKINRELQNIFDAHFSKGYNLEKEKKTTITFQYYQFLPFPFPEYISKESLCDRRGDRILSGLKGRRGEGMNILPEESCVTLRNSMVCSTSKSWKINSSSQSFLNLVPQYPDFMGT